MARALFLSSYTLNPLSTTGAIKVTGLGPERFKLTMLPVPKTSEVA